MNQFFSFERFKLLVLKHWADNKRRYSLTVLAFVGLLTGWFGIALLLHEDQAPMSQDVQLTTFFFLFFVTGCLYASQFFGELSSRIKSTNFLLIPASSFEKLLCAILYTAVIFPLVFIAGFYLADSLMVALANAAFNFDQKAKLANIFIIDVFEFNNGRIMNFFLFFISLQSLFLLGSVYFRKYNFIKTIISGFVIWMIGMALAFLLHNLVQPLDDASLDVPEWAAITIITVVYLVAPLIWMISYYRLKVKQA